MVEYTFAVQELAKSRGDIKIYRLAKRLGVSDSRARQLWDGVASMSDKTVSLICNAYDCTPNDFIKPAAKPNRAARKNTKK